MWPIFCHCVADAPVHPCAEEKLEMRAHIYIAYIHIYSIYIYVYIHEVSKNTDTILATRQSYRPTSFKLNRQALANMSMHKPDTH